MTVLSRVRAATRQLCEGVAQLEFALPVTHVYNPLEYASKPHSIYLRRFASTPKRVVYLGMNPGPYGMVQTGVPFGEVEAVRDWLGIEAPVSTPVAQHPKRPVDGFACRRSEVSGQRLWSAIAEAYGSPEKFFAQHFIANYCPLVFMEESGRNRTPDKLPAEERAPLFALCDHFLRRLVDILEPEWVVGVGAFSERRAKEALAGLNLRFGRVLHPSPASPLANRGWAAAARKDLTALGICQAKRLR